jgi:predicted nucleic acid-binding protein
VIVVPDSSLLIILSKIGYFPLLRRLYPEIVITPEVYGEVVLNGLNLPGAFEVANAGWIELRSIANIGDLLAKQASSGMGIGELNTIPLAKQIGAAVALMDDLPARRVALAEGLALRGTVGILENLFARNYQICARLLKLLDANAYMDAGPLNRRLKLLGLAAIS